MQILQMAVMLLSATLFDTILGSGSNVIPTKEEQVNLLTDVQEVFEQIKVLVSVETNSTDESVVEDIDKMVWRAEERLLLMQELFLLKTSWSSNSVCTLEYKDKVKKLVEDGREELKSCSSQGAEEVVFNSCRLTNTTLYATERGQNLLDTMYNCSRKPGFQVISCYKNVIAKDVRPVKQMLLGAIEAHKEGHFRTIEIRKVASDCVDGIVEKYQLRIGRMLDEALHCSS